MASVIGFDEPLYRVGEGDGFAEICVSIQSPDPSSLPSTYSATVNITTVNGSATSKISIYLTVASNDTIMFS